MDAVPVDSDRRPILFVSLPESGLINGLLALAGELSRRGVPDLWFATDDHRAADVAEAAVGSPVEFAPLGEVISELSASTWDEETYRAVTQPSRFKCHRAMLRHSFNPALQKDKYRALEEVVEKVRPSLMVLDIMSTFAVDLAITKGIPYVLTDPFLPSMWLSAHVPFSKSHTPPGFPVPHSGLPHPDRMKLAQKIGNRLFRAGTLAMFFTPSMLRMLRKDKECSAELGISPEARKPMAKVDRAELILCFSLAELDYPFPMPDNLRNVGPLIPPIPQIPDEEELKGWLDARSSVVYMGFGTVTRLTAAQVGSLLEVVRAMDGRHQFLWKLPKEQQHLLPPQSELPDNLRVENWVPSQLDVLAHPNVRLFFTHGGGNGFHEGLYFGKPLVVRPLWMDCYDQAVRGEDTGVSLTLDRPGLFDPSDVTDKLTRVLEEPSFRERAEHFGALLREAGGRNASADEILKLPALN